MNNWKECVSSISVARCQPPNVFSCSPSRSSNCSCSQQVAVRRSSLRSRSASRLHLELQRLWTLLLAEVLDGARCHRNDRLTTITKNRGTVPQRSFGIKLGFIFFNLFQARKGGRRRVARVFVISRWRFARRFSARASRRTTKSPMSWSQSSQTRAPWVLPTWSVIMSHTQHAQFPRLVC